MTSQSLSLPPCPLSTVAGAAEESAAGLHDGAASIDATSDTIQLIPLDSGPPDHVGTRSPDNGAGHTDLHAESLPHTPHGAPYSLEAHAKGTVGNTNSPVVPDDVVLVTKQEPCSNVGTTGCPTDETQHRHAFGEPAKVIATGLPTLPPFLKDGNISKVTTSGSAPTQRGSDEGQTSEVHEAIQIDGLGNAGNQAVEQSGCKCVIT